MAVADTTIIGAAIVLTISVILAATAASNQSGSTEAQELEQLNTAIQNIEDIELAAYWQEKLTSIMSFWNSPTGGVGTDLDNIASEGTGGIDVKNDVNKFHDNAMAFVNNLIPSKTPGSETYWERPFSQDNVFAAQGVPYPIQVEGAPPDAAITIGQIMGWYGALPQALPGPPLGGTASQMVLDPSSALPFLLLGIQSYLTIESLLNVIDTSQTTFRDFLTQFNGDLQDYANFLYSQYALAVNGIVKSEIPSEEDRASFLYYMAEVVYGASFPDNTPWWGGSNFYSGGWPYTGYAWNGAYGVVDSYPPYGVYQPSPPAAIPASSPSFLIDLFDTENIAAEFAQAFTFEYLQAATLSDWVMPWLQDKLTLGVMARWKAIYIINGYDKVWSILQGLYSLTNQGSLPEMTLDQDGTIANGNWSTRELLSILNVDGDIMDGIQVNGEVQTTTWTFGNELVVGATIGPGATGYSLFMLVAALDNIANGNWAGPPAYSSSGNGPARPLGFRDRLAAAAV